MDNSSRLPDIPESSTDPLEIHPVNSEFQPVMPENKLPLEDTQPLKLAPTTLAEEPLVAGTPDQATESKFAQVRSFLIELAQTAILALILFLIIDTATARIRVQSISMQPTLYESDFVLVNRLAYRLGDLHRKDVIVFNPPLNAAEEPYIKRIIGLPGDNVRVTGGQVYVNEQLLQETYLKAPPGYNGVWEVPEGSVFVLGDNRNNSSDSHAWGMVPVSNILGKALVVYWPVDHWKLLDQATASAAAP
jgi:signal peptidase I